MDKRLFIGYLTLLRPHQYVKNLFIFMPLFFGSKFNQIDLLISTLIVFILFSFLASGIYIFNDYHDIEEDQKHPQKRHRPLASGLIQKKVALWFIVVLFSMSLIPIFFIHIKILALFVLYLIINILYSIMLKHISIIDVFIVASGFVLRLYIGAEIGDIPLSVWILIMTFLLALFLAFAKRRDDVLIYFEKGEKVRQVIDGYNLEFLNMAMIMVAGIIIVSYVMYTVSPEVTLKLGSNQLYLSTIFVIAGVLRYLQITLVENASGSPSKIFLKDRFLQVDILAWLISFAWILY